jgi:predicted outer membrane repeat protein
MKAGWMAGLSLGLTLMLAGTAMAQTTRRVGQGETYATITAALAAATAGDTILVTTNVLTEPNIIINKSINIAGLGMNDTILQAATVRSNQVGSVTVGRIFTITTTTLNVTIRDIALRHGYTNASGGAISMIASGAWNLSLFNCNFATNDSSSGNGGAVYVRGDGAYTLTISNCVFQANVCNSGSGGGIYYDYSGSASPIQRVFVDDSSFVGNWVSGSGGAVAVGLFTGGPVVMRNCTIYGNRANTGTGGGLSVSRATHLLSHVTIATNYAGGTGGGIRSDSITVYLTNSIVAGNIAGGGESAIWKQNGTVIATNCLLNGTLQGVNSTAGCILNQDPKTLPPANNGGLTLTCALASDSPCIDQGLTLAGISYDQRGPGYPRGWYAPDMGAFEWLPAGRGLAYATNTFYEWFANNGTINNDNPMRIALANDTFLGTNGQDFVASSLVSAGNVPAGLTVVVTRTDSNNVLVTLTGTAAAHTSADNVNNMTLAFADAAFTGGNAAGVTGSTKADIQVKFIDAAVTPVLTYTGAGYWEVAANDGSVSNLPIVVTLASEHFAGTNGQNLAASGWVTASGLPAGLTLTATKISDFQVNLALTGAASLPHNASNSVENLAFQFLDSAFFSQPASAVTDATKGGFFVRFLNPRLNYGGTAYTESVLNDGSMGNTLALTLFGDALTGTNNEEFVASGKVTASNVPTGLTAAITRTSVTNLTASLTGKALQHAFADSIANLTFTFQGSAFSNTLAAVVTNYAVANLAVNFITNSITYYVATDGVDVGRTGLSPDQAFKTITNALAKCRDAASDVVQIGAGTFGQTNIALSKVVIVRGMGRDLTILQGGSGTNTTSSRFFTTSGGNNRPIVIRDLTMRYGGGRGSTGDNTGGAIYQGTQSPLYIFDCTIASNCANGGGAVYVHDGNAYYDRLIASNCTFLGNTAFTSEGGAVRNVGGSSASFYGCTFLGNTAKANSGGAIYSQVTLAIHNSTFWGNRSGTSAGAIWNNAGNSSMYNCTMVSNSAGANAGAIYAGASSATMAIYNSIIGTNTSVTGSANIQPPNGTAFSVYRSVIYGTYGGSTLYDGCITGQDPKVLPPADNGGPVMTCALQSSSPCIGAANATTSLAVDQRGYARDATPDIGAFEYGAHDSLARGTVLILY